jgi:hypothetical protein
VISMFLYTLREWCRELGRYGPMVEYSPSGVTLCSIDSLRTADFDVHPLDRVVLRDVDYEHVLPSRRLDAEMKAVVLRWVIQGLR